MTNFNSQLLLVDEICLVATLPTEDAPSPILDLEHEFYWTGSLVLVYDEFCFQYALAVYDNVIRIHI